MKVNKRNHFELACKTLKLDPSKLPDVSVLLEEFARPVIALYKLQVIIKAWNGSWVPNWNNSEPKWCCLWWMDEPGFRFFGVYDDVSSACSTGGSRLAFVSEKLAEKAGKELDYLFADLMGGELPKKSAA